LGLAIIFTAVIYLRFNTNYVVSAIFLLVFLGVIIFSERNDLKRLLKL